jgi:hypothetical protein
VWYGKADCNHVWRYREDGWEEGCVPAICIECGAFGCMCDSEHKVPRDIFFNEGQKSNANINGKWINPYVKREEK